MKKRQSRKLTLSRETLRALDEQKVSLALGLSPGSDSLNCETVLYHTCKPNPGCPANQSASCQC